VKVTVTPDNRNLTIFIFKKYINAFCLNNCKPLLTLILLGHIIAVSPPYQRSKTSLQPLYSSCLLTEGLCIDPLLDIISKICSSQQLNTVKFSPHGRTLLKIEHMTMVVVKFIHILIYGQVYESINLTRIKNPSMFVLVKVYNLYKLCCCGTLF